jgi:lipopolysaccharide transport system ATP-binding protein
VLAVGDAQFQKKCMGKMEEVGKEGRTVLFVSHNTTAIEQLCSSALHLKNGMLHAYESNVRNVITNYLTTPESSVETTEWQIQNNAYANQWFNPNRLALTDSAGKTLTSPIKNDQDAWIWIEGDLKLDDPALQFGYAIYNEGGHLLYWTCTTDTEEDKWIHPKIGINVFKSRLPRQILNEGKYQIEMIVALYSRQWIIQPRINAPSIYIEIRGGLSNSPYWMVKRPGLLAPVNIWE